MRDADGFFALGHGTCAETPASEGDCERGDLGSFRASTWGIRTLAACAQRCLHCRRCSFVSLSLAHGVRSCMPLK